MATKEAALALHDGLPVPVPINVQLAHQRHLWAARRYSFWVHKDMRGWMRRPKPDTTPGCAALAPARPG